MISTGVEETTFAGQCAAMVDTGREDRSFLILTGNVLNSDSKLNTYCKYILYMLCRSDFSVFLRESSTRKICAAFFILDVNPFIERR